MTVGEGKTASPIMITGRYINKFGVISNSPRCHTPKTHAKNRIIYAYWVFIYNNPNG